MWDLRLPRVHHLLSSFLSFSSGSQPSPALLILRLLFFFPRLSFHPSNLCLSSCPPIYMPAGPHPFNVLTEWRWWWWGGGYQQTTHGCCTPLSPPLFCTLPACCCSCICISVQITPPSNTQAHATPSLGYYYTHTHTNAPPLLPRDFYPSIPGSLSRC